MRIMRSAGLCEATLLKRQRGLDISDSALRIIPARRVREVD